MLFLVISTPLPGRPSTVVGMRKKFWRWIDPLLKSKQCRFVHARVGRGAVALFDLSSNEELHAILNGWSEIIPAQFELYPLIDSAAAQRYLGRRGRSGSGKSRIDQD